MALHLPRLHRSRARLELELELELEMKTLDSDALGTLTRALGVTGAGAQKTELMDGQVDQVLDIGSIARRGRTLADSTGIYMNTVRNIHVGGSTISTDFNPFAIAAGALGAWPAIIPRGFDLWLLSASVREFSGDHTGSTGAFFADYIPSAQGFGIDSAGVAVVSTTTLPLVWWDDVTVLQVPFLIQENGSPYSQLNFRIRRGTLLRFVTISTAAVSWDLQLVMGLFPISLGQDAAF